MYWGQDVWNCAILHLQVVWRNHLCIWGLSGGAYNDHLAMEVYWLLAFDRIHYLSLDFCLCFPFAFVPCFSLLIIFFSCPCASCSCCPVSVLHSKLHKQVKCSWLAKNKKINKSKQSGLSLTHSNSREHLKNFLICLIIFEVTVMHNNPDLC